MLKIFKKAISREKGMAFIQVLIFLFLGSVLLVPLLDFVSNGIKSSMVYDKKTSDLYAANAGIQDGTWWIKYGDLNNLGVSPPYNMYDYSTVWHYDLAGTINNNTVNVGIKNIWVPSNIAIPTPSQAAAIIDSGKLVVTSTTTMTTASIKITYTPASGEHLAVQTIGVWLPRGFSYATGTSNLEQDPMAPYYSVPVVQSAGGNQVVLWTFSAISFDDLPGVGSQSPKVTEITFDYGAAEAGAKPDLVAWLTTSGVTDIPFAWDADTRVFKISSAAGDTSVDVYTFKSEIRRLASAVEGDYKAIGNSLMTDTDHDYYGIRDTLLSSSDAAINTIPSDAEVGAAYLYWTGWLSDSSIQQPFTDTCTSLNNWNYGSPTAWSVNNYRFQGHYSSGGESARLLTQKNPLNLSSYPAGTVKISWDQWVSEPSSAIFSDSCANFNNWNLYNPTAWSIGGYYYNNYFSGHYSGGDSNTRFLTLKNPINLSAYAGSTVTISWDQWVGHGYTPPGANDGLDFAFSDDGNNYDANIVAFRGDIGGSAQSFSYTIPAAFLTSSFKLRFQLVGFGSYSQYCYIDNIQITTSLGDADGLYFAMSNDGGINWSSNIAAFTGDIGTSAVNFSYTIPSNYLSSNFKFRFYLAGFSAAGANCYLDNIKYIAMPADAEVAFKINGTQVYFDGSGQPAQGGQQLIADTTQVIAAPRGFSYSCYKDVTTLVRTYSTKAPDPATNHPGNGTYAVGSVQGSTGDQLSHAGWSLIVVYTSPATEGHQLFLFDRFTYADDYSDLDFDHDGNPGGYISGFIVPNQIPGEQNAASLTCFVGEGDDFIEPDFIAFNAPESYQSHPANIPDSYKLWDGTYSTEVPNSNTPSHPDNVWNGKSLGSSADGIDIDSFNIPWSSGLLQPGDSSARIDIYTDQDNWNLIYIIISFRSSVKTGNTLSYLIR